MIFGVKMMKILLAEDEADIRNLLALILKKEGYDILICKNGMEALEQFHREEIHLVLLDIMMPEKSGIYVMEEIRKTSTVPIIFITAMGSDKDKVLAFGLGADDYLVKPINPIELIARVSSQLRRCYKYTSKNDEKNLLIVGEIALNVETYEVFKNNVKVELNPKEFKILHLLMKNAGKVYTKKQIYEQVWDELYLGDDNCLLVHLSRLREKIGDNQAKQQYLKTIRGIGYKIERVNLDECI